MEVTGTVIGHIVRPATATRGALRVLLLEDAETGEMYRAPVGVGTGPLELPDIGGADDMVWSALRNRIPLGLGVSWGPMDGVIRHVNPTHYSGQIRVVGTGIYWFKPAPPEWPEPVILRMDIGLTRDGKLLVCGKGEHASVAGVPGELLFTPSILGRVAPVTPYGLLVGRLTRSGENAYHRDPPTGVSSVP